MELRTGTLFKIGNDNDTYIEYQSGYSHLAYGWF